MKYLLISAVFSLNVEYANLDTCQEALSQVQRHDERAICIPSGKDKSEQIFDRFLNMVEAIQQK